MSVVAVSLKKKKLFPQLKDTKYPNLPENLTFLHAEAILAMYPDRPRKQRETAILQKYPAVFFSSRSRHMKLQGDWSSDVCSSDLCVTDGSGNTSAGMPSNLVTRCAVRAC